MKSLRAALMSAALLFGAGCQEATEDASVASNQAIEGSVERDIVSAPCTLTAYPEGGTVYITFRAIYDRYSDSSVQPRKVQMEFVAQTAVGSSSAGDVTYTVQFNGDQRQITRQKSGTTAAFGVAFSSARANGLTFSHKGRECSVALERLRDTDNSPFGYLDYVDFQSDGQLALGGWAADANANENPLTVNVNLDGAFAFALTASQYRTDLEKTIGGRYGAYHGYSAVFWPPEGTHEFCAVALNVGAGSDTVLGCKTVTFEKPKPPVPAYRGDDAVIFRPGEGRFYTMRNPLGSAEFFSTTLGNAGTVPLLADFDGDKIKNLVAYNTGAWQIHLSTTGAVVGLSWGEPGDIPAPADYSGDGLSDYAVYRPSNGTWYVWVTNGGQTSAQWGSAEDVPVPGDFDGDGKADYALYRPSVGNWFILNSAGAREIPWGNAGSSDIPVPGDYNGDGVSDLAIWRPTDGNWYIWPTGGTAYQMAWGEPGDVPVTGDFDGDKKTDATIYRPSSGQWFFANSLGFNERPWGGVAGDVPLLNRKR